MLVDVLKDNHVETKGVRFDPNARTALAFVTLQENGEREFMFYRNPSADMLYSIGDIDVGLIQKVILHTMLECFGFTHHNTRDEC